MRILGQVVWRADVGSGKMAVMKAEKFSNTAGNDTRLANARLL